MKRFRCFSNSHTLASLLSQSRPPFRAPIVLPETLISPDPSSCNFLASNNFHSKTACRSLVSLISSIGSASVCASPLSSTSIGRFRSLSTASCEKSSVIDLDSLENDPFGNVGVDGVISIMHSEKVLEIVDMIRRGDNDLESKLNSMNVGLSIPSISKIFQVLNSEKLSALRLFDWIRDSQPNSCYGNDICSLVIDNCGRLDDYDAMLRILKEFRSEQIYLTPKAFGFIYSSSSKKASVRKVANALKEVGGSCQGTGVSSLIEMLSVKGSFEMAELVMQITGRKISYYNILIREYCRRSNFGRAIGMLNEMRQVGLDPDVKSYNYMLSTFCKHYKFAEATKLFEEMQEMDCPPDAITYEIFICYSCKVGNFDYASELLDSMELKGIKPRVTTYAAFVKGYFHLRRYKEAYKYVVDFGAKNNFSDQNAVYSLLARLFMNEGNAVIAQDILTEMITKGLKPNYSVYLKVLKVLSKTGRMDLAEDLKNRFSSLL